jgi:hypothetical protein
MQTILDVESILQSGDVPALFLINIFIRYVPGCEKLTPMDCVPGLEYVVP